MINKLIQIILGKGYELRESMLRSILMIGGLATIVASAQCFFVMELNNSMLLVLVLISLLAVMGICQYVAFKYRKYELAGTLIGLLLLVVIFPVLFCMSGGIEGGASVWLALGIVYVFLMFRGAKFWSFLALAVLMYVITYSVVVYYPEVVVPMPSRQVAYGDSLFSVIAVGLVAGGVLKVHMRIYEEEHRQNIAQRKELEQSRDARNIFFANMSHEIRSPINAIIGLNEMTLRSNPSEEIRSYARDIEVAGKLLLNQVNDILDLSQMEMNKMHIVPVSYSTVGLIGELVEVVRVQAEKKKLELRLNVDNNLPLEMWGDEKHLKQILLNILDNAVKYTEQGYVTLVAEGERVAPNEILLKFTVADTGIGIRKEDMEYLYDSFNRADEKHNTRIAGSGLGLAITKQLVDLMEGEITVDSIYKKGTVFTVTLKQKIVNNMPIGSADFHKYGADKAQSYHPSFEAPEARVLVVDDNRMNSTVASRLLEATKVQVDVANSGAECLELTKQKYYHVILLDYMMPGMNGPETLTGIRKQENGLCKESAIVALSGNVLASGRVAYLEQGFDGYVEKPIQGKSLELEIMQFLPRDIIEVTENVETSLIQSDPIQKITSRKRKKLYITADCPCDVPRELLEKYDIKLMYLYIKTPEGRFADTREIDADSLTQYISSDSSKAYAQSGTVEEYEEFFAQILTEAEQVIHISVAAYTGKNYEHALAAAKCFDHVKVIDSGMTAGGMGIITLCAARLAKSGVPAIEICKETELMKNRVQSRMILPGTEIFYRNGRMGALPAKFCKTFQLRPYVAMTPKKMKLFAVFSGSLEQVWRQAIRVLLLRKRKISPELVYITHAGCSVKQQEWLRQEVCRRIPFEKVIMQKASFTNACNAGLEAISISYISQ